MGWVGRKFDNLGNAVSGAGGGMGLSQAPAFTQAYLQRLGGHLDEARRTLDLVERGILVPELTETERAQAVQGFSERVTELEAIYASIADASPLMQPVLMLRHGDSEIATRAWEAFTPAVPIDAASLIWTGVGVLAALLLYELFKSPAAVVRRRRRMRYRSD
jgi:predicted nucleic acid-binding protein